MAMASKHGRSIVAPVLDALEGQPPQQSPGEVEQTPRRTIVPPVAQRSGLQLVLSGPRPRPSASRAPPPRDSTLWGMYRRQMARSIRMGRNIEKSVIAYLDHSYAELVSGFQDIDARFASVVRSSYPREMAKALGDYESAFSKALTDLSLELKTGLCEYEHFVREIQRAPTPTSWTSEHAEWETLDARGEVQGGARSSSLSGGAGAATGGAGYIDPYQLPPDWGGNGSGKTRLELVASYLESLDGQWVEFETSLEKMCERLDVDGRARSNGGLKTAVCVGEGIAGGGAVLSVARLVAGGPSMAWGAGLILSTLSFIGLERWRRELGEGAEKLEQLRDKTRKLNKKCKAVVDGYRTMAHMFSMEVGGGMAMLDSFDQRKAQLMREIQELRREASV